MLGAKDNKQIHVKRVSPVVYRAIRLIAAKRGESFEATIRDLLATHQKVVTQISLLESERQSFENLLDS